MARYTKNTQHVLFLAKSAVEKIIFHSNFYIFLPAVLVVTVLINGIWISPAAERMWLFSLNPYSNPFTNQKHEWLLDNYLLPWLTYTVGANSSFEIYVVFCFILFFVGLSIIFILIRQHHGDLISRSALILFAASPLSLTSFGGLGYVDFITIFFSIYLAFFWNTNIWVLLSFSFTMGINHFGQGFVIIFLSFLTHFAFTLELPQKRILLTRLCLALFTITLSYISLKVFFYCLDINQSYTRISYVLDRGLEHYSWKFFRSWNILIYSLFCSIWILIAIWCYNASRKVVYFFTSIFIFILAITFINLDQTRVFSILTWPILLILIKHWPDQQENKKNISLRTAITLTIIAAIILPKYIVWNGKPHKSLIYHDIDVVRNAVVNEKKLDLRDKKLTEEAFMR